MSDKKSPKAVRSAPKCIITPDILVSRYRKSIKDRMQQATITQFIKEVDEEANEDDDFEEKIAKKYKVMIIPDITNMRATARKKLKLDHTILDPWCMCLLLLLLLLLLQK